MDTIPIIQEVIMSGLDKPFRTGKTQAKKTAAKQQLLIDRQRKVDELELAETEDVIARKKAMAKSGSAGRSLLTKTSEAGVKANNLGGVQ